MTKTRLLACVSLTAALAACSSGDITLAPTNIDTSTNTGGGGGGATNPCASYTVAGSTRTGSFDGSNCTYDSTFVSETNPLTVDVTIPFFSGVHIFQNSLFVGTDVSSGAAPASGTGPKLTIQAGQPDRIHRFRRLPAHQPRLADHRRTARRPRRSRSRASRTP